MFRGYALEFDGYSSDDNPISDRAIYQLFLNARATYYRQMITKRNKFNDITIQHLKCVELELAEVNECPTTPPTGCVWLKSTCPLPPFIMLTGVTDDTGSEEFDRVEWNKTRTVKNKRIKSNRDRKYFTIKDSDDGQYLYLPHELFLKNAHVSMIPLDPIEATAFCGKDAVCQPLEQEAHMTQGELDVVMKLMLDTYTRLFQVRVANRDVQNNDEHGK